MGNTEFVGCRAAVYEGKITVAVRQVGGHDTFGHVLAGTAF